MCVWWVSHLSFFTHTLSPIITDETNYSPTHSFSSVSTMDRYTRLVLTIIYETNFNTLGFCFCRVQIRFCCETPLCNEIYVDFHSHSYSHLHTHYHFIRPHWPSSYTPRPYYYDPFILSLLCICLYHFYHCCNNHLHLMVSYHHHFPCARLSSSSSSVIWL
jgi:hypothetical protein